MNKKRRYFIASILSIAIAALAYSAIDAGADDSLANVVADQEADQLVGGEWCVKLRRGKCSGYFIKGGKWHRQVCPEARPSNIIVFMNCGNATFTGYTPCGGVIPDRCRDPNGNYQFGGQCIKIATTPGCVGGGNGHAVPLAPTCP